MNREEALEYFKNKTVVLTEEEALANAMAIKALKQEPTPKNDLGVDCISRQAVLEGIAEWIADGYADSEADCSHISSLVTHLPSVTPQEPQSFKWCTDCREYDQEKHCCHRYSKVIRDTIEEMKQEPILDKIRAKIEKLQKMCDKNDLNLMAQYSAFGMVLDVLDEYKAETE